MTIAVNTGYAGYGYGYGYGGPGTYYYGAYAAPSYYVIPPGSGLEGQYIPDYTEKLYDDGSYKPYLYEKWLKTVVKII